MSSSQLNYSDMADQLKQSLPELGPVNYQNICGQRNYEMWMRMMKKHKMKMEGGTSVKRSVQIDESGSARMTGIWDKDVYTFKDVMQDIEIPLRFVTACVPINELDLAANRGKAKIRDRAKSLKEASTQSLMNLLEDKPWQMPTGPSDKNAMFGFPYWFPLPLNANQVSLTDDTANGFTGGDPAGFSAGAAGLTVATTAHWNPYADIYADVTFDDYVARFARAMWEIDFDSPKELSDTASGDGMAVYGVYTTKRALEVLSRQQNDQVGFNIGVERGKTTLFGHSFTALKTIARQTYGSRAPTWLVNWAYMDLHYMGGFFMKTTVRDVPDMHLTQGFHTDLVANWMCRNRKRSACLAKVSS